MFQSLKEQFSQSRNELKKTSTLTISAILIGLAVILTFFTFQPNQYMKIGFSSLPVAIIGMLFGPFVAGLAGGIVDILAFILKPTGIYFPGFTFNKILMGIFFGIFLYRKKPNWKDIIIVRIYVTFIVNLLLNSLWLWLMYGQAFWALMPTRFVKNMILFPVEIILLYLVCQFVYRTIGNHFSFDRNEYVQVHRNTTRFKM